ncbi:unnamed protein product [Fusarium graminearum]|uniref:Chromosome 2, complete genome n=1 Tax=Gibberella zeae (strain ATCC MYA-4620 / CBS 123657 / FGSC 9075 / NRRL 31084 / PH-1) TaxID=229533 RepID=A0A098DJC3_GIBZE|nr:unnamed protein product [Fusarium graminearum]
MASDAVLLMLSNCTTLGRKNETLLIHKPMWQYLQTCFASKLNSASYTEHGSPSTGFEVH